MANKMFNVFMRGTINKLYDIDADQIWCSFHGNSTTIDTQGQTGLNTNADFTTPDELSGTNYVAGGFNVPIASVNRNDTTNVIEVIGTNLTISNMGPTSQQKGILVYWKALAGDAWSISVPICWLDAVGTPDGNDWNVNWNANTGVQGKIFELLNC